MTDKDHRKTADPAGAGVLEPKDPAPQFVPGNEERTPEERERLRHLGLELVAQMFSASKTILLYDMKNRAAQRALAALDGAVRKLHQFESHASIRVAGDLLQINDCRIAVDAQHYGPFAYVVDEMKKRRVATIEFGPGVGPGELGNFLTTLLAIDPVENAYDKLQDALAKAGISAVSTTFLEDVEQTLREVDDNRRDLREESNRVYFRTVALMGDVLRTIEEKHILQVRKAKRLTQQMVDIIQMDESMLVGLTSIKNFDTYTFVHSVNVCILSMLIGDHLRLNKSDVARLGVSGMFHDIGKTYVPSTIINSTGPLGEREWELMKYHNFFGVKELSRMNSLREAVDPMFVSLQHHVHYNYNGYPCRPGGWKLRLFSRIVTIADYFDAMTACRTYQKNPITPDRALRFILENSGEIFDPFIAKVFIQAMGLYPIGTIVELDSGELSVVIRRNPDPRYLHRPIVEIIDGEPDPVSEPVTVDLSEKSSGEYSFRKSIVRSHHDMDVSFDKRAYFLT